jgi:exosome complex RNA-binding protein Rrp4
MVRTQTLVQASADVVTVVSLRAGDVFKRLVDQGANYGESRYKAVFGVVQSVDSNGDDVMVSVIEFDEGYAGPEVKHRVFGTDAEVKVFAATVTEMQAKFVAYRQGVSRKVEQAERALADALQEQEMVLAAIEQRDRLTEVATADV